MPSKKQFSKSRRNLLKLLGLTAGATTTKVFAGTGNESLADQFFEAARFFEEKVQLVIYRPQDLLELKLTYTGYKKSADNKTLIRSSSPNLLFVEFQPQSIAEQAWEEAGGEEGQADFDKSAKQDLQWNNPDTATPMFMIIGNPSNINPGLKNIIPPAKTYLSGNTRLVFDTGNAASIPLTPSALLNWSAYRLVVNKRATCVPAFTIDDTRTPAYKKDQFKINPVINQPANPNNNQPIQINNTTRPVVQDTVKRQAVLNRNMRAATKEEAKEIQKTEMPVTNINQPFSPGLVNAMATLVNSNKPYPVGEMETSIEVPYRLFLSPNQFAAWKQEAKLKNRPDLQGSTLSTYELWHTRLMSTNCQGRIDTSGATKPIKTVRALWGTDINGEWSDKPERDMSPDGIGMTDSVGLNKFITSLYNDDRHCIVHQTSNFSIAGFTPKPVQVNNLMLSTLGAWLDASVAFKRPELKNVLSDLNMLKWKHVATLARDHYVEVVYAGNMFPFGHEAALVRITERKPKNGFAGNWQRYFVAITEEEKKYNPINRNGSHNAFPFSTIRIVTAATPTIKSPDKFAGAIAGQNDAQFVPTLQNNQPFKFKIVAYDLDGGDVSFEMPLVFVSTNVSVNDQQAFHQSNIDKLTNAYKTRTDLNTVSLRNQLMALARSVNKPGETHYETASVIFTGVFDPVEAPGFIPKTISLSVFTAAVENITGLRKPLKIELVDDRNKGNVFAKLSNSPGNKVNVNFNGSGNKTGGSLSPNFSITGLSKTYGVISGKIEDAANAIMDPVQYFNLDAKLFGIINLSDIIKATGNLLDNESPIPALKNIDTDEAKITQYTWKGAELVEKDLFGKMLSFKPAKDGSSRLKIETNLYRYKNNKPNALTVDSTIENFDIIIAKLAKVGFKKVGFHTGANTKTDFTIDMKDPALEFLGPLTFVNALQKYIPADGFSDPPFLDITTSGVTTGYTLSLPDVQLGAFTLRNISLGASVALSFTGGPLIMRFNFCEKHQPFTLTVSALGGGGFFAIEFDVKGIRSLEAALEFGAAASINLGVASGAVSIMGGLYFKIIKHDDDNKEIILEGYVRINGALSVLGLITASVEFLLSLTANLVTIGDKDKVTKVWGKAQLKIKIEVFMFSKTVSLETSREFAGAGADPNFAMLISNDEWKKYCESFAA